MFTKRFVLIVLVFQLVNSSCVYHDLAPSFDCSSQEITIVVAEKTDPTSCENKNGSFRVEAFGSEWFRYKINEGLFEDQSIFQNLSEGIYFVYALSKEGCVDSLEIEIKNFVSDLSVFATDVTGDSECIDNNGSIKVEIENGAPPFLVYLDDVSVLGSLHLQQLGAGVHNVRVLDSTGCEYNLAFSIPRLNTAVSWNLDIKPIITRSCAKSGCHGVNSSRARLTTFDEVKANAANVKSRTQNNSMPYDGPLPQNEVDLIACWVDDGAIDN